MDISCLEIFSGNAKEYLGKILKLQDAVYEKLKEQGREHLFFRSSEDEIREYINSEDSIVAILKHKDELASVCYFTFNHSVYNDLTLYIKNSSIYKEQILSTLPISDLIAIYIKNVSIYNSLRQQRILTPEILNKIREKSKNNDFFENDPLRQELSEVLRNKGILSDPSYPWLTSTDLSDPTISKKTIANEYDEFISYFQYKYLISPKELNPKLTSLSDTSVGELDTYFSSPLYRNQGYASTLIEWSIRRAIARKNILAMSATVHPENTISQHILKNLDFKNFCTVERRKNVPRDVMFKVLK